MSFAKPRKCTRAIKFPRKSLAVAFAVHFGLSLDLPEARAIPLVRLERLDLRRRPAPPCTKIFARAAI